MSFISSAELVIFTKRMYPEGCRVSLERMVDEPYAKLHPGDLGTVRNVDDAGQIHISWDQGSSVAVIYKVDSCNCLMTKEQMDETLAQMKRIPLRIWTDCRHGWKRNFFRYFQNCFSDRQ